VLCRTDHDGAKSQEGISFILVDMKTPGVEVRPIITMDGGTRSTRPGSPTCASRSPT
jgi:alkylation response protein AidB-like acyl-CoA dehydrogenase